MSYIAVWAFNEDESAVYLMTSGLKTERGASKRIEKMAYDYFGDITKRPSTVICRDIRDANETIESVKRLIQDEGIGIPIRTFIGDLNSAIVATTY